MEILPNGEILKSSLILIELVFLNFGGLRLVRSMGINAIENSKEIKIKGSLIHEFSLKIDNSFKVIDYKYKSNGEIIKSKIILKKKFTKKLINSNI